MANYLALKLDPLPSPDLELPIVGQPFTRPDPEVVEKLRQVPSATASALLHKVGIRHTWIEGPVTSRPGVRTAGPAVTLQFMPQREDVASGQDQEQIEKSSALWHVLDAVQPGDILAVAANGDRYSGCMGEMLFAYLKGRGGAGAVIDGRIRDWANVEKLELPIWSRGRTPNYASQAGLFPWAYNVPVAMNGVLVLPGDVIIADDDGAVVVPAKIAPFMAENGVKHETWEVFSRMKLAEGGSIWRYYPLSEEGLAEYDAWNAAGRPQKTAP